MAQQKTITVPVIAGMREDLSPHMAPPGTLSNAENVRFPIGGEVESRRGTTALSIATSAAVTYASLNTAGPDYLERVPGGFVFGVKGFGYRYDFGKSRVHVAGSYGNALPIGRLATMAFEEATTAAGITVPWPLSQATQNGYVALVWSSGNGQGGHIGPITGPVASDGWFVQIFTTGGTLVGSVHSYNLGSASAGWVVADGSGTTDFIVIKQDGTALKAAAVTTSATGFTIGSFATVGTLNAATNYWGACNWPGIGWALIYQSGATTVTVRKMAGTASLASTTFTNATAGPLSVYCDATNCYTGYSEVNAGDCVARGTVYDTALVLTSGGTIALFTDTGAGSQTLGPPLFGASATASTAFVVIGHSTGPGLNANLTFTFATTLTAAGVAAGGSGNIYGLLPVSAPFDNGMIWCRRETARSLRCVLLDFQTQRASSASFLNPKVALVTEELVNLADVTYYGGWYLHHLCPPASLGGSRYTVGLPRVVRSERHSGADQGLTIADWVTFDIETARTVKPFGNAALVTGDPVLSVAPWGTVVDDTATTQAHQNVGSDLGLYSQPFLRSATASNAAGLLTSSATYEYRAVLERIDSGAIRYRSAPSNLRVMTTGASDDTGTIIVDYPEEMLRGHTKELGFYDPPVTSRYVVHIYRTTAGGSTFYRCTPPQGAPIILTNTLTYVDEIDDDSLSKREILYTDGGVLDNNHPPSCRFLAVMEDRIWLGGLWEENEIQSSKILVPGEPPQFSDSPAFVVVLPSACTGLAAQDGVLVAFCESAIYAVQGFGPNDQGQGEWGSPRVITRSTGCINELSILETSSGIFFQSARGIELLPRGLGEPQFVGAGIQLTLGTASVVSTVVIKAGMSRTARFCLGTNVVLVFDLDSGAWSRDTYPMNVTAICDTDNGAVLAMKDVSSGFGFLLEGGSVVNDSTGNTPVAVSSVLQWTAIRPAGVAGQMRFTSAIGMFDELASDSSPGYQTANASLFVTVDDATDPGKAYDMGVMQAPCYRRHAPLKDSGTAVILKLTTAANGWRFMGWTLETDDQGGGRRMPETEQG